MGQYQGAYNTRPDKQDLEAVMESENKSDLFDSVCYNEYLQEEAMYYLAISYEAQEKITGMQNDRF